MPITCTGVSVALEHLKRQFLHLLEEILERFLVQNPEYLLSAIIKDSDLEFKA